MRKGKPLPALPSYGRSTIRNSFIPVFDPAENFKPEAPRINPNGLEGPDRSQAVSDAPQDADAREKIRSVDDIREARRERAGLPHHVKAGDPSLSPFGVVGPVPVDEFWKGLQEVSIQEPGDILVTGYAHGTLRIGSIHFAPPLDRNALVPVTQGPTPRELFAAAPVPYGYWQGEPLLHHMRPGEESVVLASLSDDVERIKACRELRTPSPDPQCSGPGYAHAPHGNCMGYGTDRT